MPNHQSVVTIRMSNAQHDALLQEANDNGISINRLCIHRLFVQSLILPVTKQNGKPRGDRGYFREKPIVSPGTNEVS
jgi:hypothetical protein